MYVYLFMCEINDISTKNYGNASVNGNLNKEFDVMCGKCKDIMKSAMDLVSAILF